MVSKYRTAEPRNADIAAVMTDGNFGPTSDNRLLSHQPTHDVGNT